MKKTKSKKINFTNLLTLVVIILTLLSIYLTVIYRAKPYLYIEDVQLISNGETIYGDIANGGNKPLNISQK